MYIGGGGVVVVALVVAAVLVLAGGGGTSFASLEKSKTCTVASFPNEGQGHTYKGKLIQPTDIVPYKTDPATSGHHFQVPAPWGVYTEPIPRSSACTTSSTAASRCCTATGSPHADRAQAEKDVRSDWKLMLMAPYPKLGDKVYFVAWQHWIACTGYQKGGARRGAEALAQQGPREPDRPHDQQAARLRHLSRAARERS